MPSLLPMSMTREFLFNLNLLKTLEAYSSKCLINTGEVEETYKYFLKRSSGETTCPNCTSLHLLQK